MPAAVALAVVVALSAAPALAAAPEAPDQTHGMAIMSASVTPNGQLIDGAGVKEVGRSGVGAYLVTFVRRIVGCNYVASIGRTDTFITASGVASAWRPAGNPTSVFVMTHDFNGALADRNFQVIVFCAK